MKTIRKIMLLGDPAVGKTSIIARLVHDRFDSDYKSTIGTDVHRYEVIPSPGDGEFQFLLFDTDGYLEEGAINHAHLKGSHGAVVVGDLSRPATLDVQVSLIQGYQQKFPGRFVAALLNKRDLVETTQISDTVPLSLKKALFPVVETSAKTGMNVQRVFSEAAATILRRGHR